MKKALADVPREEFARPAGIQQLTLDATTGRLASDSSKNKRTDIFPSWYKPAPASSTEVKIDKLSGKLATECTPELAIQTSGGGSVLPELPAADPSYSRWNSAVQAGLGFSYGSTASGGVSGTDDRHSCSDTKPKATLEVSGSAGNYIFTAKAISGTFPASTIQIKLDGQIIGTKDVNGNGTYVLPYVVTGSGSHSVKVTVIDQGYYTADSLSQSVVGSPTTMNIPSNGKPTTVATSNRRYRFSSTR